MRRRKRLPSQLAADLGVSHATVSRWLSDADVPNTKSCRRLAKYSGVPLEKVLSIVGHLPRIGEVEHSEWPEFREYAQHKYPNELDEDVITMIEDLIERRRERKYRYRKISKWESELWSYIRRSDRVNCPLHDTCKIRQQGRWCFDENKEMFSGLYDTGVIDSSSDKNESDAFLSLFEHNFPRGGLRKSGQRLKTSND